MRTVADYLELLPQPYRTAAIIACTLEGMLDTPCESLSEAIISFDWNEYAINDTDKSWAELYSMALISESDITPLWGVSQDNIVEAQISALKDMGFDLNPSLN